MSHTAERLKRALEEFGDMVPEDVVRAAHAFIANHAAALSRARSGALEEAWRAVAGTRMGDATASETRSMDVAAIRALIAAPAPASIPVERVQALEDVRNCAHMLLAQRGLRADIENDAWAALSIAVRKATP